MGSPFNIPTFLASSIVYMDYQLLAGATEKRVPYGEMSNRVEKVATKFDACPLGHFWVPGRLSVYL